MATKQPSSSHKAGAVSGASGMAFSTSLLLIASQQDIGLLALIAVAIFGISTVALLLAVLNR